MKEAQAQDVYRIDSFEKMKSMLQENKSKGGHPHYFDPDYFSRPQIELEQKIRGMMENYGILNLKQADMPHWEGPFISGKKLDVARYLQGNERCMKRLSPMPDGLKMSGTRIVCQLALLGDEDVNVLLKRALAALVLNASLIESGQNSSVMFCWSSRRAARAPGLMPGSNRPSYVWVEASDMSIARIAQIMSPEFWRTWIFAVRSNDGPFGAFGHGSNGGQSSAEGNYEAFRDRAKEFGILRDGDVCLNWNLPIEEQIRQGMEIIG